VSVILMRRGPRPTWTLVSIRAALSFAAISAQPLYAAPSHLVCITAAVHNTTGATSASPNVDTGVSSGGTTDATLMSVRGVLLVPCSHAVVEGRENEVERNADASRHRVGGQQGREQGHAEDHLTDRQAALGLRTVGRRRRVVVMVTMMMMIGGQVGSDCGHVTRCRIGVCQRCGDVERGRGRDHHHHRTGPAGRDRPLLVLDLCMQLRVILYEELTEGGVRPCRASGYRGAAVGSFLRDSPVRTRRRVSRGGW
jgi:hypothetical protein